MSTLSRQSEGDLPDASVEHPEERRSTLSLLRNVVLDLTQVVEDSTELVGASVREELAQFRDDMARHALALAAVIAGAFMLTAGLALLLNSWLESWPATLLIFGSLYIAAAIFLRLSRPGDGDGWR